MSDDATATEIATTLFLSVGTVRNYLSSAIGKTATRNRMEALRVTLNEYRTHMHTNAPVHAWPWP